jgi:hypothetical protein
MFIRLGVSWKTPPASDVKANRWQDTLACVLYPDPKPPNPQGNANW